MLVGLVWAVATATTAAAEIRLSDPGSEVYYTLAVAAGERVQIAGGAEVLGDVHSNGEIQLNHGSRIDGAASAVGRIKPQGEVTGPVSEEAAEIALPVLLDEAGLQALADRVIEGDATFDDDLVLDEVLLVAGAVRIRGSINGTGTLIALGDITFDGTANADGGMGLGEVTLEDGTLLSLIATGDVRFGQGRPFRGAVRAGRDVDLEKDVTFDGVLVADRRVDLRKDALVRFRSPDTAAPLVTLVRPEDGALLAISQPVIEVALEDDLSGVDGETLVVLLDGEDVTAEVTRTETGFTFTPDPLPEGAHELEVTVSDVAGNEAVAAFGFVTDTEPPTITVLSPVDGVTVDSELLTVSGTVTDTTEVVGVTVNGEPAALAGDSFIAEVLLAPGPNILVVEATDVVGNTGSVALTVTLRTDTTPPELTITAPPSGIFVTESRPPIDLSFRDDDSGVDKASLTLTANGAPLEASCDLGALGGRCVPVADLPEGPVDLAVSLADLAGNIAGAAVQFTVDTEGLTVTLTSPEDGLVTSEGEVQVTGVVEPPPLAVEVNGVVASVSGGGFSATIPLREGVNMVVALATKPNGRTATGSIEVTRDLIAPIVRINSPRDGFVSVEDHIAVTGRVNDSVSGPGEPQVTVNGIEVPVAQGAFLLAELPLKPGANVIEAVATDAVGNEGRHQITVERRKTLGLRLGALSGQGQTAPVNQTLPEPLVVQVTDDLGIPVAGRVVRFEVSRNSGTLRPQPGAEERRTVQVLTDGAGQAAVLFTLGDTAGEGNNRVRVTATGVVGEVEFCASSQPAAPDKILMVDGDNQRGVVGAPLAQPLEALVVDADGNPLAGVEVTFRVVKGSGTLDGETELRRLTDSKGLARAVLTLGLDPGINNNVVSARFEDLAGLPATFTASGLAAGDPAQTRLAGVVLDNGQTPIPGARVTIGETSLETFTDEEGQFLLEGVPVGHIHLEVDPTDSPRPEEFPALAFETVTVAGQRNTIGQPILIPALDTASSKIVGGDEDVTLTMEGVEGLTLTVFADSTTFPDGSSTGRVTISQVHLDKVPMPPPAGSLFMPPAWTIQPAGVRFDPPARVTIPNNGLPPGRVIDIFQFDHTLNEFISVGKGTVSDDGFLIASDPGFGVTRAGWGGAPQPRALITTVVSTVEEACPDIIDPLIRERDLLIENANRLSIAAIKEASFILGDLQSIGTGFVDIHNLVVCLVAFSATPLVCTPAAIIASPALFQASQVIRRSQIPVLKIINALLEAVSEYTAAIALNDAIVATCALTGALKALAKLKTVVEEFTQTIEPIRSLLLGMQGNVDAARAIVGLLTGVRP